MIRVAIVDDESSSRAVLAEHLKRYELEEGVAFDVRFFASGAEFSTKFRADYSIIFLDVQMEGMDGFATANHIRSLDSDVVLVFVTNMAQHAIRGYEVDALSYLLKPVPYFAFSQELKRSLVRVGRAESYSLLLPAPQGRVRISAGDILYIESDKHRITAHLAGRSYTFSGTLKALEEELAPHGFFRASSWCLVNLQHVTGVKASTLVVADGSELQVSRAKRKDFMNALTDHLGGRRP